jgi:membrane dipeptidase
LLVDGHEDLALNVLLGRDYIGSTALEIRAREEGGSPNGLCMLSFADWRRADVGVVFATIAAIPSGHGFPGERVYRTPEEARELALAQLAVYQEWEKTGQVLIVEDGDDLYGDNVALILLMENADPIRDVDDLAFWRDAGVRIIGPAWHANRYSADTREPGPLTPLGRELVGALAANGMALDVTHMADEAIVEALELYGGPVCATHAHSRRTVDLARLLPDHIVLEIAARDGIVGVLPVNWALQDGWRRGDPRVPLERVVAAVDDLGVDERHVAIGTDWDGGQGAESAPVGLETIGDLPKLRDALGDAILGGNWLRWLGSWLG